MTVTCCSEHRYASRAKSIKNRPRINEDPKDALLRKFQEEIQRLKSALEKRRRKGGGRQGRSSAEGKTERDGEREGSTHFSLQ